MATAYRAGRRVASGATRTVPKASRHAGVSELAQPHCRGRGRHSSLFNGRQAGQRPRGCRGQASHWALPRPGLQGCPASGPHLEVTAARAAVAGQGAPGGPARQRPPGNREPDSRRQQRQRSQQRAALLGRGASARNQRMRQGLGADQGQQRGAGCLVQACAALVEPQQGLQQLDLPHKEQEAGQPAVVVPAAAQQEGAQREHDGPRPKGHSQRPAHAAWMEGGAGNVLPARRLEALHETGRRRAGGSRAVASPWQAAAANSSATWQTHSVLTCGQAQQRAWGWGGSLGCGPPRAQRAASGQWMGATNSDGSCASEPGLPPAGGRGHTCSGERPPPLDAGSCQCSSQGPCLGDPLPRPCFMQRACKKSYRVRGASRGVGSRP